jgi:uncharacterized membrane protein
METRIEALERRLELIEARLGIRVECPSSSEPDLSSNQSPKTSVVETSSGGKILGAIAVFFFVLAGMYMVKLAIDSGWLTPARQLGLTVLFGLTMVAGAFWVRRFDSPYSGYLAATGVVVLFLAAYGGTSFFGCSR